MKMKIDGPLCTGHGRCFVLAPEVYDLDDNGYNAAAGGTVDVPAGHEDEALVGMNNCPEGAISIAEP